MELLDLARSLVGYRTEAPGGSEEPCARFLHDYLADLHVDGAELILDRFEPGRANLVARFGPPEPGLLLSAHLDVVPAGDEAAWSHPPFEARVAGGRMYGRGASDTKAGLAAMAKAAEGAARGKLRRSLVLVATAGEEAGFVGLRALLRRGVLKRGAAQFGVVAEPTGLTPVRAHRGCATFRVAFRGKSGHASSPELGVNAIEGCSRFIAALAEWRRTVAPETDADLGRTTATPTVVAGGTKSNVIPGSCELTVDSRWIPEHGTGFVRRGLRSAAAAARGGGLRADVELLYETPSLKLPSGHPLVTLAEEATGRASEVAAYGTEASLYTGSGIPSVVIGPGNVSQAHVVDEHVPVAQLGRALATYARMIRAVCAQ